MLNITNLLKKSPSLYSRARCVRHMLHGFPEPELGLLKFLVDPARSAIDVGAHSGLYTAELLRLASSVISIEALPELARNLERLYPAARVINAAASCEDGQTTLHVPIGQTGLSTVSTGNPVTAGQCVAVNVNMIAIDSLQAQRVGFMKIDVEGHELDVLRGAEGLLKRDMPVLLIEAEERHRPDAVRSVERFLVPMGYTGLMLDDGLMRSLQAFEPTRDQNISSADWQLLNKGLYDGRYINNFVFLP